MISTDNPKHARLRRIVSNAFNPRNVRRRRGLHRTSGRRGTGPGDGRTGRATSSPTSPHPSRSRSSATMMGVPASEYATVLRCSNIILSAGDPEFVPEGSDPILAFLEAGATLTAIMEELGAYRLDNPIDDITSALVNAEIESEKLTQQELASFFVLLVTAGNETTRTAIAHALHALTEHPDQKARLIGGLRGARQDVDRRDRALGLAGDLDAPHARRATTRSRVSTLKPGRRCCSSTTRPTATRRPSSIRSRFDVGRTPNDHYGFGAPGPHFCLGAHLARREITVMWRELLKRAPDDSRDGRAVAVVVEFRQRDQASRLRLLGRDRPVRDRLVEGSQCARAPHRARSAVHHDGDADASRRPVDGWRPGGRRRARD